MSHDIADLAVFYETEAAKHEPDSLGHIANKAEAAKYRALAERAQKWPGHQGTREPFSIDAAHLTRQAEFSRKTFGPGTRLDGVLDHIEQELAEVRADPTDPTEWADLIILACDGAWRQGIDPQTLLNAIEAKQARNEARVWPDWRTMPTDKAITHVAEGA